MNGQQIMFTNEQSIVDAKFDSKRFQVYLMDLGAISIYTDEKSDNHTTVKMYEITEDMIEDTVWTTWMLQGVKDKELAKKLEGKV